MPTPGTTFALARVKDPSKTSDEAFNRFYDEEMIPQVLDLMKSMGMPPVTLRYKNANPESDRPYLAMYPYSDVVLRHSPKRTEFLKNQQPSTILGGHMHNFIDFEFRMYEKIQAFEGYGHADEDGTERGQTLICVAMEPGSSAGQEQDFDDWYRKQHLDVLSMCRGYRRTTRYKRLDSEEKPRYLALHEFACESGDLPGEQIKQVTATEWSRKIFGEAQVFERDVFELLSVQGDGSVKL